MLGGYYYYGIDPLYIFLVLPAVLISLWAQIKVKSTFAKYAKQPSQLNGADAARRVMEANGVYGVRIERIGGSLNDHYDPKDNVIRLSDSVYDSYSIAAVGVAAHEAGHAVQYDQNYNPIKWRTAVLPVAKLGSNLALPLILIGFLFHFTFLFQAGILFFCAAVFFQLITLPVEFNASRRAIETIRGHQILMNENDIQGARRVLSAAAMTYVAALLVSLMQLLRFIALSNRRR